MEFGVFSSSDGTFTIGLGRFFGNDNQTVRKPTIYSCPLFLVTHALRREGERLATITQNEKKESSTDI